MVWVAVAAAKRVDMSDAGNPGWTSLRSDLIPLARRHPEPQSGEESNMQERDDHREQDLAQLNEGLAQPDEKSNLTDPGPSPHRTPSPRNLILLFHGANPRRTLTLNLH